MLLLLVPRQTLQFKVKQSRFLRRKFWTTLIRVPSPNVKYLVLHEGIKKTTMVNSSTGYNNSNSYSSQRLIENVNVGFKVCVAFIGL